MTFTKRSLKKWGESMWVWFTPEQERIILERFGAEPEPNVWSEQDILEQIRHILIEHPSPQTYLPDFLKREG